MAKANLRMLTSPLGPFHKAECSDCGKLFNVPPETPIPKDNLWKQFDVHLSNQHRLQWEARERRNLRRTSAK